MVLRAWDKGKIWIKATKSKKLTCYSMVYWPCLTLLQKEKVVIIKGNSYNGATKQATLPDPRHACDKN